ncbi:hypothetical protein PR202_gb16210 [Eleusine coracana subsp. coracana]|uniref:Uncharacterized protein n=1 Tax=Eleusine coracana subsp. coracana TaxID=191504 RepID=A0AAV5F1D5_ELECO|nr:hypothetical protein PR202_gb16210 [Eleusine coracana subsp. coracana]
MATAPPRPPSPGLGAVPLSSAIDDLLRFVLATRAADPDDSGLSLSPAYCTRLLDDGDLFAKLAAGLVQCVEEGRMPSPPAVVGVPVAEDDGSDEREKEWEALLLEKGAELKQVIYLVTFNWCDSCS